MYIIRPIALTDELFLWQMLYEAAHLHAEDKTLEDAKNHPELVKYVKNWGQQGDFGLISTLASNHQPIGAAWLRLLTGENQGYGYIDDETPELAIAILPEYRNQGVGTELLRNLITISQTMYRGICLSIRMDNPAFNLYKKLGWQPIAGSEMINRVGGISIKMKLDFYQ
jgi:ribosomal protein S18 acetylase RimI-like enzyme